MIRTIGVVTLLVLCAGAASGQSCTLATCTAASANESDVIAAFPSNSNTHPTVVVIIPSGTGTWTSPFIYTVPSGSITSLTIQGQTIIVCNDAAAGTSTYTCTPTDNTVLIDSVSGNMMFSINLSGTSTFRMTGLTLQAGALTTTSGKNDGFVKFGGSTPVSFRFDHNHLQERTYSTPTCPAPCNIGGGMTMHLPIFGVADHNLLTAQFQQNGFRLYPETYGFTSWSQPSNFGTANFFFAENNVFDGGFANDCNQGGRQVYRYNMVIADPNDPVSDSGAIQEHNTGQGVNAPNLGCRETERYHNYYLNPTPNFQHQYASGDNSSGPGLAYADTFSTGINYPIALYMTGRLAQGNGCGGNGIGACLAPPNGYGYCGSGSSGVLSVWDGNSDSTGYPCLTFVGRGQGDLLTGGSFPGITNSAVPGCTPTSPPGCSVWPHQLREPVYVWNETCPTCQDVVTVQSFNGVRSIPDRDYYTQVNGLSATANTSPTSPFNGTTGTGWGPINNRPATCTAGPGGAFGISPTGSYGVAYFATDHNRLYVCTATNTWTFVYAPFVYPHPLVSGGGTPTVSLSPASVAFGNVLLGSTSPSTTVTLSNIGGGTLTISPPIALTGANPTDFNLTNNCGTAVLAGGSCTLVVSCTPASAASFSASISITDNAAGSPHTVPLTCTGVTSTVTVGFAPASVTFAAQTVGTSSSPTAVTLTNTGSANLTLNSISISGGNSTSFSQTNNCVNPIAPAAFCTINVVFSPQIAGALASNVLVGSNATGSPQSVPLSGNGNGAAAISFTPSSLPFGNQAVNVISPPLTTTVANTGTAAITLTSVTLTGTNAGAFILSANTCGGTIAVGANCTVSVEFEPGSTGGRVANLTFTDSAPGSPQNVALTGTGTLAAVGFSPTSLAFGNQTVSTTSPPLSTVLTNTGSVTLNITSISVTGANASDFVQTNNCSINTAPAGSCTINVTFTPAASASRTANISVADNAPASPQTVPLTGTGIGNQVVISPSSLAFPPTAVGQSSPTQTITYLAVVAVSLTSVAVFGGNSGDFSQTNNCATNIPANGSCLVVVTFKPTATGARSSAVVFQDSATGTPHSVAISGTGTQSGAQVVPTSITFPNTPVGTTSAVSNVTLTNNGTATLNISSIALGGTDPSYFAISSNTCGSTLAINTSCIVGLTFTPQTGIHAASTLSFTDDGPGSPQVVSLSGLGTFLALSFNPTSLSYGNVNVGTTSGPLTITMMNNGNDVVAISSITITGTNPGDYSLTNNCPPNLSASGSCSVAVSFLPTASGLRSANVQFTDNAPGSPQTVALSGTGVTPTAGISLSPTSLTFASQGVGTSSASQPITVSNPGSANLVITGLSVSGDYSQTNNCGTVAPLGSCTVNVVFSPTTTGTRTGTLTITDNAAGSPHTAPLSGTGAAAAVSFVPASLTFPSTALSVPSSPLTTTLMNTGGASLTGIAISIVGTNAGDYSQNNNCGSTVLAGGSCTINVTFTPGGNGSRTANVQVVDNIGTQTVALTGTGFTPAPTVSLSPTSLNFGNQVTGTASNQLVVILTNTGTATLTISSTSITGTNPGDFGVTTTCGASVAVNASCAYQFTFMPSAIGGRSATFNLNTNAASSPDHVSLSGTGVAASGAQAPQVFGD